MGPEWNPREHLLKQVSTMKFIRLKQPFEIFMIDSFQEGYKALQKYPQTWAYKASLHAKPYQMFLVYLRRLALLQLVGYNQMLQKFHVVASNWLTHDSDGRKPDWFGFKSLSSKRKL